MSDTWHWIWHWHEVGGFCRLKQKIVFQNIQKPFLSAPNNKYIVLNRSTETYAEITTDSYAMQPSIYSPQLR